MNPSILDNVELAMATLIPGMNVAAGYNYNWKTCNEEDLVVGDFPRTVINPTDSLADKITNLDTKAGLGSLDYTQEVLFTLLSIGELNFPSNNPDFAIRSVCRHMLDDLLMLFGRNYTVNNSCDGIMFVASQIEIVKRNDIQRPGCLRSIWRVWFSCDRSNPSVRAGS